MDIITVGCDSGNYSNAGGRDYDSYNWQPACTDPDRIAVGRDNSSAEHRTAEIYARAGVDGDGFGDVAWKCFKYIVGASNETLAEHNYNIANQKSAALAAHNAKVESDKALAFAHIEISIERPAEDLRPDIYSPNTTIV